MGITADHFDMWDTLDRFQRAYDQAHPPQKQNMWTRVLHGAGEFAGDMLRYGPFGTTVTVARMYFHRNADAVAQALQLSESRAQQLLRQQFSRLNFVVVWDVLWGLCKQTALYVGGGAVVGAAIGGVATIEVGGAGAIPGAWVGGEVGMWLLTLLGLKDILILVPSVVRDMAERYRKGFAAAWLAGGLPHEETAKRTSLMHGAVEDFAHGHMMLLVAILMGIVLYLSKGQVRGTTLFAKVRVTRLGPKFAAWLEENQGQLLAESALRPKPTAVQAYQEQLDKETLQKAANQSRKATDDAPQAMGQTRAPEVRNGYEYQFDNDGNVSNIDGDLTLNKAQGRNTKAQLEAGGDDRLPDDQGGHWIGRRFDGPMDDFNHFAQNGNFNNGAYRSLENSWDKMVSDGQDVHVNITPEYPLGSTRPSIITVRQTIDGVPQRPLKFGNNPGGKL